MKTKEGRKEGRKKSVFFFWEVAGWVALIEIPSRWYALRRGVSGPKNIV
jgi:hypothetical protein